MKTIMGNIWKFGDNIDTDVIVPGLYLDAPMGEILKHVFGGIKPGFAQSVKTGDVIIAGKNFGCGSSREQAPSALKTLGIGCIVAKSFGRIFFRNAIAIGLPILISEQACNECEEDETVLIYIDEARIENNTKNISCSAEVLSKEMLNILKTGGLLAMLKKNEKGDI